MTAVPLTEEDRRKGPTTMQFYCTMVLVEPIHTLLDAGGPRPARG